LQNQGSEELSFIIVNWNGGELLKRCIESIVRHPPSIPFDIWVVDNASTDGSVDWLHSCEHDPGLKGTSIHVIENRVNLGFSKANNQALAESQAPMVLLLNPDTEITPGAIDTLVACLNSDERIGACGPRLLNTDGSLQHSVWRNPPTAWEIVLNGTGLWRLIPRRVRGPLLLGGHWDHSTRRSVPLLFGAAILAKRKMIEEVGALDERFHMYGEDYEWCLRITRAGWRLIFEPAASITHHGGQFSLQRWSTSEKLRVQMNAGFQYNSYCLSRRQSIGNVLATCFISFLQSSWSRIRGRPSESAQIVWEMHLKNLKELLRGR
jgi:GT2 family glycosyltransferase